MAIKYIIERVEITSAQLADWSGRTPGKEMRLTGPCPVCLHDSPEAIAQETTVLEGIASPKVLAVSLACTCEEPHPGRPEGAKGCGRHWSCTTTSDAGNQVTLSPLSDPVLRDASDALRTAGPAQVNAIRGAAEKWIGGVTALFSLFGLAGIVVARSTVAGLVTGWQIGIGVAVAISVALAARAIFWIYRAAYGWPVTVVITDDDELRDWYAAQQAAPATQAGFLKRGVRQAGFALSTLVVTVGLLWFAPAQSSAGPLVQVTLTDGSQVCGTLLPAAASGTPRIRRASDGTAVVIPVGTLTGLTVVATC